MYVAHLADTFIELMMHSHYPTIILRLILAIKPMSLTISCLLQEIELSWRNYRNILLSINHACSDVTKELLTKAQQTRQWQTCLIFRTTTSFIQSFNDHWYKIQDKRKTCHIDNNRWKIAHDVMFKQTNHRQADIWNQLKHPIFLKAKSSLNSLKLSLYHTI